MAKIFRILLDAGHGEGRQHNRGGIYFNEGDNNYKYSLILKRELEKIPGVKVDLVRTSIGQNPSVSSRSAKANGYDLFLSLHSNAAGASVRGTEIFDSAERPNKALAQKLVNAISKAFNHNNRGVKYKKNSNGTNWYGVLRNNRAKAAMIIEHGFHTNKADSLYFRDNHATLAKVTANVIRSHYGLSGGTATPSTPSTDGSKELYRVRKSWADAKTQKGAYASLQGAIDLAKKNAGYKVYDSKGTQVYPKPVAPKPTPPPTNDAFYRVRSTWANAKSQKGAFTELDHAVAECKKHKGYHVYDMMGRQVYPIANVKPLYRVRKSWGNAATQIGAFKELDGALELARSNKGHNVYDDTGKIIPVEPLPSKPVPPITPTPSPEPEDKPETEKPSGKDDIPIMGKSLATAKQMEKALLKNNPKPKIKIPPLEFATIFLEEGEVEGVRGDIAFCQAMKETGWLAYGGQVLPEQNNYAGIGATNNSATGKGNWFDTERDGIRAQIQHLKAYGSKDDLVNENIDPRFKYVTRGIAPNWIDLNGRWAVPGKGYGQEILEMYIALIKITVEDDDINSEDKDKAAYMEQIRELKAELAKALSTIKKVQEAVN